MAIVVVADYRCSPGSGDRVAAVLARHVAQTRAEPGCLAFTAYRDTTDPDHFVLHEEYVDDAAFEAHRESAHFLANIQQAVAPLLTRREFARLEEVPPDER
jgi:quinol monooxygenase YgiN